MDPRIGSILDRKIPLPTQPPLPQSTWVQKFAKDSESISSLPLQKAIFLKLIADWVVECDHPGTYTVVKITAVGHAENGEKMVQALSLKRAVAVLENLKSSIKYETQQWHTPARPLNERIEFRPVAFASVGNKRAVEVIFERSPYIKPSYPPFSIMQVTEEALRYWRYRNGASDPPTKRWWKLPTLVHKDEWRELVRHIRKETVLQYFDLKTIVEAMWDIGEGQAEHNPNASADERQKWTEEAAEKMAEAWAEFDRDLQKRTADPPGDPEEED